MFNPIEFSGNVDKIVSKGTQRKYYKFKPSTFHNGIAAAYCLGCDLSCSFCTSQNYNKNLEKCGKFYSPREAANELIGIAKKEGYIQCQISGGEPAMNWEHLMKLLEILSKAKLKTIIETNGILIGYNDDYAKQLSKFKDMIMVRVGFKGATPEEFSKITGASPEFFELQIIALKNLYGCGVPCHPVVMKSFSRPESIERLRDRLENINSSFYDIEEETLACGEPTKS